MKKEPEYQCVASDNGVELWVEFTYDLLRHTEEFHGQHSIDEYDIKIQGVDLVVGGKFISIKKTLSEDARASLIKLLEI